MWLGLLYLDPDDDEEAVVVLCAWETGRPRPLTIAATLDAVPQMVRMLRQAGTQASIAMPRCDACGTSFDLPLD